MSNGVVWFIIALCVSVIVIATAVRLGSDLSQQRFERRSERHWEDVEKCENAGGQIVLGESQWFEYCILP